MYKKKIVFLLTISILIGTPVAIGAEQVPEITIFSADKTGGFYSDEMLIKGQIKGNCIASAGIFEDGREVTPIMVEHKTKEDAVKYFRIKIDASQEPEIVATSCSGQAKRLKIDVFDYRG